MTNEKNILIHRIFAILISALTVIAGACFIAGCLSIYNSGPSPYTPEAVSETFSKYCIPIYSCAVFVFLGIIIDIFLPDSRKNAPFPRQPQHIIERLTKKRDILNSGAEIQKQINDLRKKRKSLQLLCLAISAICAAVFLGYSFNRNLFYRETINETIIKAMIVLIPCFAVAAVFMIFVSYKCIGLMEAEAELLKQCPEKDSEVTQVNSYAGIIRSILLILAVAILVYGIVSGGTADVLTKAKNICTECIGLG